MGRSRFKWKCAFISYLVLLNVFTKSLPVYETKLSSIITTDTKFRNPEIPVVARDSTTEYSENIDETENDIDEPVTHNLVQNNIVRNMIRPEQRAEQYAIELTDEGDFFRGRAVIDVVLSASTREDPIKFYIQGLDIEAVRAGLFSDSNANDVDYGIDGEILEVSPGSNALSYVVVIEYTGQYSVGGRGFHKGSFDADGTYLAMNLHPTYARHVFPCMDEPTEESSIRFTFNNLDYTHIVSNSRLEDNSTNQFRALAGPPHVWGMMAHNFVNINIPTANVLLYARPGLVNQDAQASVAINFYFNNLNEWTNKNFFEIILDQDGRMNVMALPDVSTDWHSLSTIGIWEPNIFMQTIHSVKQRKIAFFEIARAMAKQWFGYVIIPENWRYEWVISGLASYTAYEMMRLFQENTIGEDVTLLDVNTLFITEIMQESLLRDAYVGSEPLEPNDDMFDENDVRDHVNGLLKYKAPALLRMMRIVLGNPDQDFIQSAARSLLNRRTLQTVNSLHLVDGINSEWLGDGNGMIDNVNDYLEDWKSTTGYPVLHVNQRPGGVLITQEHFSFGQELSQNFLIPITFTTSVVPDFSHYHPAFVIDASRTINMALGEEDWVLFNIQGQGYYRVNYDHELWERIIEALEDPERREVIHPLNRATLVDDALNLARAGKLDYETAFRVVLTMEHETEYAVWKAFVRNMEFLRKRLVALVTEDEDLDPDIYLRMVRRTILAVEDELGFDPDVTLLEPAMNTLTRGLVMEHACKANYIPCIAAAVDLFYDGDVVNPNIPHEIRPAVYCTMVREGGEEVIEALHDRLELEPTLYERVVILEALACSQDGGYISTLLEETVAGGSPYSVEERSRIFKAVAESSYENALIALNFMASRITQIIDMYGGLEKLEELIFVLAENMANNDQATEFRIWVNTQNNNLDDSERAAQRALLYVIQNLDWDSNYLDEVYEWINENNASTMILSLAAICVSLFVTLFNH